jgi:hypothetical protein
MKQIRESTQERERLQRLQQERAEEQAEQREQLRERLLAIYGEYRAETPEEVAETVIEPIPDVHVGDPAYQETFQEVRHRVHRALGIPTDMLQEEVDEDEEIPF